MAPFARENNLILGDLEIYSLDSSTPVINNGSHHQQPSHLANSSSLSSTESNESLQEFVIGIIVTLPFAVAAIGIIIIAIIIRNMRRAESLREVGRSNKLSLSPEGTSSSSTDSSYRVEGLPPRIGIYSSTNLNQLIRSHSLYLYSKSQLNLAAVNNNSSYTQKQLNLKEQQQMKLYFNHPFIVNTHNNTRNNINNNLTLKKNVTSVFSKVSINEEKNKTDKNDEEVGRGGGEKVEMEMEEKKKKSLKLMSTRVIHAINFPRKLRRVVAEKRRFNIYTVPNETREQLKHIYVY